MFDQELYNRLVAKTQKDDVTGCWNWTGPYRAHSPYPSNRYGFIGYSGRSVHTHRAMWIALHGAISRTVYVCHHCDNPLCINPEHLFAGAPRDNTHDMLKKNRHNNGKKTICKRGHPLSGDNLYVAPDGSRHCRECDRARGRQRWHNLPEFRRKVLARQRRNRRATQPSGDA